MVHVSLANAIKTDPELRKSLRSAHTQEQKIEALNNAGFDLSAVETTADDFFSGNVFPGKFGSEGY